VFYQLNVSRGKALSKKIEYVENYAQINSDYVFCVSDTFKKYILQKNYNKEYLVALIRLNLNMILTSGKK